MLWVDDEALSRALLGANTMSRVVECRAAFYAEFTGPQQRLLSKYDDPRSDERRMDGEEECANDDGDSRAKDQVILVN